MLKRKSKRTIKRRKTAKTAQAAERGDMAPPLPLCQHACASIEVSRCAGMPALKAARPACANAGVVR